MKQLPFIAAGFSIATLMTTQLFARYDVLALMPQGAQFQKVIEGMQSELDTNYKISVVIMSPSLKIGEISQRCGRDNVKALILMDASAIDAVGELQKTDSAVAAMPKFVFMTLQAEATTKGLSNVAGIRFEVPIYALLTNFQIISLNEFKNVGIFYRKAFGPYIAEAKKMLMKEQISLQAVCVDCEKNEETTPQDALDVMKKSFDKMVKERGCEVFLALADNLVMNNTSLNDFWIKKVKKEKIPVIAPFEMLASRKVGLALFAADPDLTQLGAQGANQIIEYFENGSALSAIGFEPTIAIKTTLNEAVAKELGWKLKGEKLKRIHQIIK